MKFAKKSQEIDILDYRKAYWAFDKVINKSENANNVFLKISDHR